MAVKENVIERERHVVVEKSIVELQSSGQKEGERVGRGGRGRGGGVDYIEAVPRGQAENTATQRFGVGLVLEWE